jgi:glycosyltransferase involved in cell wall biosynthesis
MAPVKQPRLFVEVARLCPDLTFVMCGDGNELEAIRVGAPSNLKITGMVDPVDYLAAADIFVSTSANDGIPYSILEAQAAGLPVVAVASGAISEIITDGVNGFLTTSRAEEIAERIGRLNKGETLRASFAAAARANSESLSLNPQLEQIHEQVYLDIIGK